MVPIVGLATVLAFVVGCGGGGTDSPIIPAPGGGPENQCLSVRIQGVLGPLWLNGSALPAPNGGVQVNAPIIFTFGGPVDVIPPNGTADASIVIARFIQISPTQVDQIPATGTWALSADPTVPGGAGAGRVLTFFPTLPTGPGGSAGITAGCSYQIRIPIGPSSSVLKINGLPLITPVATNFQSCEDLLAPATGCDVNPPPPSCFTDVKDGDPYVEATFPATSGPPGPVLPPINPGTITNNQVILTINEPLDPSNINLNTIRLLRISGAQVPGSVIFNQAGSRPDLIGKSEIIYQASGELIGSEIYNLSIDPLVTDFGGNSLVLWPADDPFGRTTREFATTAVQICTGGQFSEDFSSLNNLEPPTGVAVVNTTLQVATVTFPTELVGDGSSGNIVFAPGGHDVDTGQNIGGRVNGVWNCLTLHIQNGATLRIWGPWPAHFRVLQEDMGGVPACRVEGTLNASAFAPFDVFHSGFAPENGNVNNGGFPFAGVVKGGIGGAGGGAGGWASQDGAARTNRGQAGNGAYENGIPTTGTFPTAFYGGGEGGFGNPWNSAIATDIGGQGGAGGSSWAGGENGVPRNPQTATGPGGCTTPMATPPNPAAAATGPTAVFAPPISQLSGGSAGGGGGDRFNPIGPLGQVLDYQGGGGAGGGGGVRVSAIADVNITGNARIEAKGVPGGNGSINCGPGGSGSGGGIWLQSFSNINMDNSITLLIDGGGYPSLTFGCPSTPGRGGMGLIQFEDTDGIINQNFNKTPGSVFGVYQNGTLSPGNANLIVLAFPFNPQTGVGGAVTSTWRDTGYGAPQYTGTNEVFTLGNVPDGAVVVEYQGAFESVTLPGTPSPDPANWSPWVSGPGIAAINGFRFVRFRATITYATPPASNPANTFPEVDLVEIFFSTPSFCP